MCFFFQDFHVDELISARYQEDNQLSVRYGFEKAKAEAFQLSPENIKNYGRTVAGQRQSTAESGDTLLM